MTKRARVSEQPFTLEPLVLTVGRQNYAPFLVLHDALLIRAVLVALARERRFRPREQHCEDTP